MKIPFPNSLSLIYPITASQSSCNSVVPLVMLIPRHFTKWTRINSSNSQAKQEKRWKQKTMLALPSEEGKSGSEDSRSLKSQNCKALHMKITSRLVALDLEAQVEKEGSCKGLRPAELGWAESSFPGMQWKTSSGISYQVFLGGFFCLFHDTKIGLLFTAYFR